MTVNENYALAIFIFTYFIATGFIFHYIYNASNIVIDEMFHLPIGLKYCAFNFTEWDNKITTLPGLYLYSALLIAPFEICTVYALRFTVYISSLINICIVFHLLKHWMPHDTLTIRMFNTLNIATIPPVFFFSNVYYTDILSMTLVNAMILFGLKGRPFLSSIFGFIAMTTRQNNAVYVMFIAGYRILGHFYKILNEQSDDNSSDGSITNWDTEFLNDKFRAFLARGIRSHDYRNLIVDAGCYAISLVAMTFFIILNGSIVVGDKDAHSATVHIPQLFYFTLFMLFFAWPHVLRHLESFYDFLLRHFLFSVCVLLIIYAFVKLNTIIHPYMLADNRHYLFYVWKRFLGTSQLREVFSPIYLFGLYALYQFSCRHSDLRFVLVFPATLIMILCTQSLIDLRYYLTPYVILRAYMGPTNETDLFVEFLFQTIISACTLYIFGTKEIYWIDFIEPQRIIW